MVADHRPARNPALAAAGTAPGAPAAPWATLVIVTAGLFLVVLSTTVVSVALPTIGRDLHASATGLEWTVDAYVLVYASLLVTGGVAGDRRGRKGAFLLGAGLFGLGSLASGLAPGVGLLLAGRVLQGTGPALLIPGSLAIIRAAFADDRQRSVAVGLWSTGSGVALALGPALGGVIVGALGWRWVFLLNVPLTAVLVAAGGRAIPRLPRTPARAPFDGGGAAASAAGVGLLAFAVIGGQDHGWAAPPVIAAFAAGACVLAVLVRHERRRADPLIDVSLFGRPAFAAANLAALIVFFAFVGAIVYFSAFFQQVQGRSPVAAGLAVSPVGVSYALAAAWSGRLAGRFSERWPLLIGLVTGGLAMLALRGLGPGTGLRAVWWAFALLGGGAGLCGTPMTTLALSAADVSRAGMASALLNAFRQLGQVFGVAVLGALVYSRMPGGAASARLDAAGGRLFVAGLHDALLLSGVALIVTAAAISWPLARSPSRPPGRDAAPARPGRSPGPRAARAIRDRLARPATRPR
jgi:DHA2 family methylenomycin A resistance protein-like MFS transporter